MRVWWQRGRMLAAVAAIMLAFGGPGFGQAPAVSGHAEEEKQLEALSAEFIRAFNAGDARAVAALFTTDAEIIDENDDRVRGKDAIESAYTSLFRDRPGATITIKKGLVKFVSAGVAMEEGRSTVRPNAKSSARDVLKYQVVYVKQDGRWRFSHVREEQDAFVAPHDRLEELGWLVGNWIDESSDSTVRMSCGWTEDKNFLLRRFVVQIQGKPVMKVEERIGWDPLTRQFKSWVFDSEGGHVESLWARRGEDWLITSKGALHDGRAVHASHLLSRQGAHTYRWSSLERTVAGRAVPGVDDYVMVREAPKPAAAPAK